MDNITPQPQAPESMGARVKRLRVGLQLTQEELVRSVPGMTASALSQLESGKSRGVKPENLIGLARALGVTPEILVYGAPLPPAAPPEGRAAA